MLGTTGNEKDVPSRRGDDSVCEFKLENSVDNMTDVTLCTPVRCHVLTILDQPKSAPIDTVTFLPLAGHRLLPRQ